MIANDALVTHLAGEAGVVDAAAWWLEDGEPDLAAGLLEAAAGRRRRATGLRAAAGVDRSDDRGR
jgi:hypothetical protein